MGTTVNGIYIPDRGESGSSWFTGVNADLEALAEVKGTWDEVFDHAGTKAYFFNDDTAVHTFDVASDGGSGVKDRLVIENNPVEPVDFNIRNVVMNIGSNDSGVSTAGILRLFTHTTASSPFQVYRRGSASEAALLVSDKGAISQYVGGQASVARVIQTLGEAQARHSEDEFGAHSWGPGGSTAPDVTLSRTGANVLSMAAGDSLRHTGAAHASLPAASGFAAGSQYYCTTDKQPIWSDGTSWYEADGTVH